MTINDWGAKAACRNLDPNTMVIDGNDPPAVDYATAICTTCPVWRDCLTGALEEENGAEANRRAGIRGALTPRDRYLLHRRALRRKQAYMDAVAELPDLAPECGTLPGYLAHRSARHHPCQPCRTAYHKWQRRRDARRAKDSNPLQSALPKQKPGRKPQPIEHGTRKGAFAHKNRGIPYCEPCRDEMRDYERERAASYRAARQPKQVAA